MKVHEILTESKTQKAEAPKPRNFVAKNAINTGAGAHKDKKKANKQGDVKHKAKQYAEGKQRMSRAAKGHEKYGKAGMQALAKAGRDGASEEKLDKIRDKHNKYDESATAGATSAANVAVGAIYKNKKPKMQKPGTNALDMKGGNLMTGGSIKR